jgi:hypothetical protein
LQAPRRYRQSLSPSRQRCLRSPSCCRARSRRLSFPRAWLPPLCSSVARSCCRRGCC